MSIRPTHRKRAAAVGLGLVAASAVGASAASLGGLGSNDLGADTGVVASCDTNGIEVDYRTRYHSASEQYRVTRVILRGVAEACDDQPFKLTLFETSGVSVEASGTLDLRNVRDRLPGPGVDRAGTARIQVRFPATDVDGISVVIGGSTAP